MPSPCAHSMSSPLQNPPSTRWHRGKRFSRGRVVFVFCGTPPPPDHFPRRTGALHVVGRTEAGIRHLHHPRLRVCGGGPRFLRLLAIAAFFAELLSLALDLGQRLLRRLHPLRSRAARSLAARMRRLLASGSASTSRLSSSITAWACAICRSSVASRRNDPVPAFARIRTPSWANFSRSTSPALLSAARCSHNKRSSRSAQPTRKSASV